MDLSGPIFIKQNLFIFFNQIILEYTANPRSPLGPMGPRGPDCPGVPGTPVIPFIPASPFCPLGNSPL